VTRNDDTITTVSTKGKTRNKAGNKVGNKAADMAAKRQRILDAALHEFTSTGYANANIEAIAERAEVGKGTIYRYFESKEALFEGILASTEQMFRARSDGALDALRNADAHEQLRIAVYSATGIVVDYPEMLALHSSALYGIHDNDRFKAAMVRILHRHMLSFVGIFANGQIAQDIRGDLDPELLGLLLLCVTHAFNRIPFLLGYGEKALSSTWLDAITEALWHGVASPGVAATPKGNGGKPSKQR
jgi:AcrR family transcriptional regulator